jgi:CRP-like cAMP-binding protein
MSFSSSRGNSSADISSNGKFPNGRRASSSSSSSSLDSVARTMSILRGKSNVQMLLQDFEEVSKSNKNTARLSEETGLTPNEIIQQVSKPSAEDTAQFKLKLQQSLHHLIDLERNGRHITPSNTNDHEEANISTSTSTSTTSTNTQQTAEVSSKSPLPTFLAGLPVSARSSGRNVVKRPSSKMIVPVNNNSSIPPPMMPTGSDGNGLQPIKSMSAMVPPNKSDHANFLFGQSEEEAVANWMVLNPDSSFCLAWDVLQFFCLCYTIFLTPYAASFFSYERYMRHWSRSTDRLTDIFYFVDIFLNFHKPFVDMTTGELVTNRKAIAKKYLKGWFAFDLIITIPWDFLLSSSSISRSATKLPRTLRIVRVSRAAKLLRVLKVDRFFEFCEDKLGISRNHIVVIQLLIMILIIAHFTACGFYLAGTLNEEYEKKSWIATNKLLNVDSMEAYLTSLYWSFTMMATVGFGDIVPVTYTERLFTIFGMVISAGTYAFMIASLSATVASLNVTKRKYYERLNEINSYMKSREVPIALQLRTRQYYRYYLQRKTVYNENLILEDLPHHLREEITDHYIRQTIKNVLFFQDMAKGFTSLIAMHLKPIFHVPGTIILMANDTANEFFIMAKGVVEVFDVNPETLQEQVIAYLYEGDHFGEMALLLEEQEGKRNASVRATEYTELHGLEYAVLQRSLTRYSCALSKMMKIALARKKLLSNLHKAKIANLVRALQRKYYISYNLVEYFSNY